MGDKYFSTLNGYALKDVDARERIEALEDKLNIKHTESEVNSNE